MEISLFTNGLLANALAVASAGGSQEEWLGRWFLVDVLYRIVTGVLFGVAIGWILSKILLRLPVDTESEKMKVGVGALAATLLLYGIAECAGRYGFLAVFVGGLAIRHIERAQQSHKSLHVFAEQAEQLLMTVVLIALGDAVAEGILAPLGWDGVLFGILLLFVVRPGAGLISLIGEKRLSPVDRGIASFFGIRGVGCLFYLAYGVQKGNFNDSEQLWAVSTFTVVLSVVVHGVLAAPAMNYRRRAG